MLTDIMFLCKIKSRKLHVSRGSVLGMRYSIDYVVEPKLDMAGVAAWPCWMAGSSARNRDQVGLL